MQKRKLLMLSYSICLILVFAAVSLMTACAQPAPAPAPAPTPAPTPAPAPAPVQVVKLKFANHEPPVTINNKIYKEWVQKLSDATQGALQVEIYPAEQLAKARDMYTSLIGGVCDIAAMLSSFVMDPFPMNGILLQPVNPRPFQNGVHMWEDLSKEFPEMKAEFKDVHYLTTWVPGTTGWHFTKKEVQVPADVVGLKLLSEGSAQLEVFKAAGATPVQMIITEMYMALERGLGEGCAAPYDALRVFNLTELTNHHLDMGFGAPQCFICMNTAKWNSLTPEMQKAFNDLNPWLTEAVCNAKRQEMTEVVQAGKDKGNTFYEPTGANLDLWLAVAKTGAQAWITEQTAKGRPAQKLYDEAVRLSAVYK